MGIFEFDEAALHVRHPRDFDDDLAFGYFFKDLVVLLLDKCGYEVYPYGYESYFPNLKRWLLDSQPSDIVRRVRSTPDLLVRNSKNSEVYLIEVKARSNWKGRGVKIREIDLYKQFWPESVIILILPGGNHFYAQSVSQLDDTGTYDLRNFRPLEELFPLMNGLPREYRYKMVRKVMTLFSDRDLGNL